ncbi:MAG: adenylate/guanylate cyclase domain-containing protein, partial [Candidatus Aenigmarchaeota archaeon]|nr:adenylate/guanylate cyclase domain-containing protein [Candidatus Aenigmarchaeota archaeon]
SAYSFSDIFDNENIPNIVENKIIFIGSTAPDLHDFRITPVTESMPGVELHANAVQTILTGAFLERQSREYVIAVIFILSLIVALALYFFRALFATIITAVAGAGYLFFSFNAFYSGTVMNIFYPLLSLAATYVFGTASLYVFESRQRKLVTGIFGKYVSKGVAEHILKSGDVSLKGEKRTITTLFADIRGFTSLSEKLQPEEVVAMLNHYFDAMTKIIFKHGGTLDKFIGDCIMAEWNVPLEQENHPLLALKAAIEMQGAVKKLAKEGKYPAVKYGIGINTGPAIIGNMGSVERVDYTAIGDSVNLASRLCGAAEGGQIIISEAAYEKVKDKIKARRLKPIKVKGKEKAVTVYEVLGAKN